MLLLDPHAVYELVTDSFGAFSDPRISSIFTYEYYATRITSGLFIGDEIDGTLVSVVFLDYCRGCVKEIFADQTHPTLKEEEEFFLLVAFSVRPGYQMRGIGTSLIKRVESVVKEAYPGVGEIRAGVSRDASPASYRLFQRLSYDEYHRVIQPHWGQGSYFRKML